MKFSLGTVLTLLTAVVLQSQKGLSEEYDECASIHPHYRDSCGFSGMTQHQCVNNYNCCWDQSISGVPSCFSKRSAVALGKCIGFSSFSSTQLPTKDAAECSRLGGCYHQPDSNKYCYKREEGVAPLPPSTASEECSKEYPFYRESSGFGGITKYQCENDYDSCWDDSVSGAPYCFSKKSAAALGKCMGYNGFYTKVLRIYNAAKCSRNGGCSHFAGSNYYCYPREGGSTPEVPSSASEECIGHPFYRDSCGFGGITKYQCENRNCCWDNSIRDVPWCFNKKSTVALGKCTGFDSRYSTTLQTKNPDECARQEGCFHDNGGSSYYNYCYKRVIEVTPPAPSSPTEECTANPRTRESCGFSGITKVQCDNLNCCWDDSVGGVPYCFQARSTVALGSCNGFSSFSSTRLPTTNEEECNKIGGCFHNADGNLYCYKRT